MFLLAENVLFKAGNVFAKYCVVSWFVLLHILHMEYLLSALPSLPLISAGALLFTHLGRGSTGFFFFSTTSFSGEIGKVQQVQPSVQCSMNSPLHQLKIQPKSHWFPGIFVYISLITGSPALPSLRGALVWAELSICSLPCQEALHSCLLTSSWPSRSHQSQPSSYLKPTLFFLPLVPFLTIKTPANQKQAILGWNIFLTHQGKKKYDILIAK